MEGRKGERNDTETGSGKGRIRGSLIKKRKDGEEGKQDGGMNGSRTKRVNAEGSKRDNWIAMEMREMKLDDQRERRN